ncbi:hypothetical protein C6361_05495 [Plantactinospora sp. BC1]|uniref:hypothetical protein n=1 Tax=Plantactinospora sp. BC1 TaxID=2108470 RepID=UPI000D156ADE|nr:hypothetical protein [Plantactinospora sp. BC1]AVT29037.1 hypothetical protein C6361_05495 [Plantactinospora sp. BC1]
MRSGEERRLKLVKGTAAADPSTPDVPRQPTGRAPAGGTRRSGDGTRQPARGGRAATRRTVTRRVPAAAKDPVEEILERLDQEPAEKPETERSSATDEPGSTETAAGTGRAASTGDPGSTEDAVNGGRKGSGRRLGTTVALVAALCAALALAGVFGYRWWEERAVERAHGQALAAARQTTVNFVSVSASSVDTDLQRITAGATGEFKEEFVRGQAKVREAVLENKVESRGTVLRAGLLSGDRRHAVVLVAMDATVKNVNAPDGRPAHYRIQVDLTRDGDSDTWLVSRLQFVG